MSEFANPDVARSSTLLTVPGLCCSGPDHWQTRWEEACPADCRRVELPDWDNPSPEGWPAGIARAIAGCDGDVVIAAHSLGCHAVAQWSLSAASEAVARVRGALLVAPPDVECPNGDPRVTRFQLARGALPIRTLLVASHDDPWAAFERSRRMALTWGAKLIDVGRLGHINADSGIGDWPAGRLLVDELGTAGRPA